MIPLADPPPGGSDLVLLRRLPAPRARVFQAFTDPVLLRQWWGPRGFVTESLEFPAEEGREYRVCLRAPDGTRYVHTGVFLRVAPPDELVYTWRWIEGPLRREETLVELTFTADGEATVVSLRHRRFANQEESDAHAGGWEYSFERLVDGLTGQPLTGSA